MSWRRKSREQDLERELRSHLELEAEEQEEAGRTPEEARHAAQRAFGNTTLIQEATRETWGWTWLEQFRQDLRYSARTLRKSPGFTAAAVLSLALGIGANTAIFSLLDAVVLRLLPVREPRQLVQLTYTAPSNGPENWNSWFGYPELERLQARAKTLSGVFGGTGLGRLNVGYRGTSGLAEGDAYTDNIFEVLGLAPQAGRFFAAGEDRAGAPVAVLSDRYWRNRFGADRSIIGETVTINRIPFTVIGITPPELSSIFTGYAEDLWLPLHALDRLKPDNKRWTETFASWVIIAGRLRPEVSRAQAQAELEVLHRQFLAEQLPISDLRDSDNARRFVRETHLVLRGAENGMLSGLRERYSFPLKLLMGVAGIVLLVACANVANLLLARASSRRREIALRLALGARRGRVVRQFLTESVLLASIGGVLALAIAWWGSTALVRMISTGDAPLPLDVRPDWRIFGFTAAVSLATGILFGLAPALRGTRVDPGAALREGTRHATRASGLPDRLLVVAQVALSVVLITGAGLFARTLDKLWSVNVGYDRENILMFSVDARLAGYPDERAGAAYQAILERLQALPDVRSASASIVRPVDDYFSLVDQLGQVDGRMLQERDNIHVAWNSVSPGYFSTTGTPVLLGRDFDRRDHQGSPKVVMVNESLARRAFPGQNPLGHRLGAATVVGMVKDALYNGARDQPRPVLYYPVFQHGVEQEFRWGFVSFELRYRGGAHLVDAARREVAAVDRNLPIFRIKTLRAQAEQALLRERLLALLSGFFGALALLLSSLGLYGLMAYTVTRRTGEIGIRMALGARRGDVLWLILRGALGLALGGVAAGLPLALWAARYTRSLLFGMEPADPVTMAVAVGALLGAAALAGYLPARRAVRVDPMSALRYE